MVGNLVKEQDDYYIAALVLMPSTICGISRRTTEVRSSHTSTVSPKITILQPPSAFMERVFSVLLAYVDERQESVFSDRIAASTLLKYNKVRSLGK